MRADNVIDLLRPPGHSSDTRSTPSLTEDNNNNNTNNNNNSTAAHHNDWHEADEEKALTTSAPTTTTHTTVIPTTAIDVSTEMSFKLLARRGYPIIAKYKPSGDDTVGFSQYFDSLSYPEVYMAIFHALRVTLMVGLPLGIIAREPKLIPRFPAYVVMPLWGVVDCRFTLGEQFATLVTTVQCALCAMVVGTICNACHMLNNPSGWWCVVMLIPFCFMLLGDVRSKRLLLLQSIIVIMMEHLPNGTTMTYPVKMGSNLIFATTLAAFQSLFPPCTVAAECDAMLANGWRELSHNIRGAATAFWSEDPIEAALALSRLTTEPLRTIFSTLPGRFFFVMYEFWESTLRLELRRERLAVMRRMLPILNALTDCARAVATRKNARSVGYRHEANTSPTTAQPVHAATQTRKHKKTSNTMNTATGTRESDEAEATAAAAVREPFAEPSATAEAFVTTTTTEEGEGEENGTSHTSTETEPVFTTMDRRQTYRFSAKDQLLWRQANVLLRPACDAQVNNLDHVLQALGEHLNPNDTVSHVPFADLRASTEALQQALQHVHLDMIIKSEETLDSFLMIHMIFFHVVLVQIAVRLLQYADAMEHFDRRRYKSQWQRCKEFFFLDYWRSFWAELPNRLTLATPRDVRLLKDAIKMACAYGVGIMFTVYTDRENVYYFGMAILMSVGLPTAGDTMVQSIYRITGLVCASSIAYIAYWHTPNTVTQLALVMASMFISLLFLKRMPYSISGLYCAMLLMPSLYSASNRYVMLARLVSSCFTVMAYYTINLFVFPIDVHSVTQALGIEAKLAVTECFSDMVGTIARGFPGSADERDLLATTLQHVDVRCKNMWARLDQFGAWIPKAAGEPAPHGMPYPLETMNNVYSSLRRVASAIEIMGFSLHILHDNDTFTNSGSVRAILATVAPVMREVDIHYRVVMHDFINAIAHPHEWSLEAATRHMSAFLYCGDLLHRTFGEAHIRSIQALRKDYANRVFNRTIAVASQNALTLAPELAAPNDFDDVAEQCSADFTRIPHRSPSAAAAQASGSPIGPDRSSANAISLSNTNNLDRSGADEAGDGLRGAARDTLLTAAAAAAVASMSSPHTTQQNSTTNNNNSTMTNATKTIGNGSFAREIARDIAARRASAKRRQDAAVFHGGEGDEEGKNNNKKKNDGGNNSNDENISAENDTSELEQALRVAERHAEEEVYDELVRRRWSYLGGAIDTDTLNRDINISLCIVVATDIFFAEAERLLKTMDMVNKYSRSRVRDHRKRRPKTA